MAEKLTVAERLEILEILKGTDCACGGKKGKMRSHCRKDYFSLPPEMRRALYRPFGQGYEEAYNTSLEFLKIGKYAEKVEAQTV